MSTTMEEEFKRWTAKRKAQLVLGILQGRTTVAEASRAYDLPPSDIEEWVEDGRKGMENALRAKPLDIKEQYEKQIRELQEAYGEAMLQMRVLKSIKACWGTTTNDRSSPAGCSRRRRDRFHDQVMPVVRHSPAQRLLPFTTQCPQGAATLCRTHQSHDRGEPLLWL